jgi:transcriptional regulator with XRE-family HTH domain
MTIGQNIKAARKAKKLTQKQLAEALNLATITIQQYENDKRRPRMEILMIIASYLECTLDYLTGIVPEPNMYSASEILPESLLNASRLKNIMNPSPTLEETVDDIILRLKVVVDKIENLMPAQSVYYLAILETLLPLPEPNQRIVLDLVESLSKNPR